MRDAAGTGQTPKEPTPGMAAPGWSIALRGALAGMAEGIRARAAGARSSVAAWRPGRLRPRLAGLASGIRRGGSALPDRLRPWLARLTSGVRRGGSRWGPAPAVGLDKLERRLDELRDDGEGGGGGEASAPRLRRLAEAGIGIAAVVGALAIVGALVVAFGLRTAGEDGPQLEVSGEAASPGGPIVSNLDLSRTVGNLEITLLRVERLTRGGRVYLRADNGGRSAVAIPDSEITLRQRFGQARPAPNRGARLPHFGKSIRPGDRAVSVLYFPRLRKGGAVVTVQWFSAGTQVRPKPVRFSFEVH